MYDDRHPGRQKNAWKASVGIYAGKAKLCSVQPRINLFVRFNDRRYSGFYSDPIYSGFTSKQGLTVSGSLSSGQTMPSSATHSGTPAAIIVDMGL